MKDQKRVTCRSIRSDFNIRMPEDYNRFSHACTSFSNTIDGRGWDLECELHCQNIDQLSIYPPSCMHA